MHAHLLTLEEPGHLIPPLPGRLRPEAVFSWLGETKKPVLPQDGSIGFDHHSRVCSRLADPKPGPGLPKLNHRRGLGSGFFHRNPGVHGGIWGQGEVRRSAGGQKTWGKLHALVHNLTAPVSGVYGWEDHVSGRQACTFLGQATESVTYEGLPAFAAPNKYRASKTETHHP